MLLLEFQQGGGKEVQVVLQVPQEVQHAGDCVHSLGARYYIQARKVLADELERTVSAVDNLKSCELTLYELKEPSEIKNRYFNKVLFIIFFNFKNFIS